jgi:mannose-1-phosphate guanylyltransferase
MKAFILAAGLGTRLRPLTDFTPKCLLPVCGRPLLSIWLSFCLQNGIDEVMINTHHLAAKVEKWAAEEKSSVRVHLIHEPELLGSAGTVLRNWEFVAEEPSFFVFYADNLVRFDLSEILSLHQSHSGPLTMALFETSRPEQCGVVQLDPLGRIVEFAEKPSQPKSNLANAGIYIARSTLREYLPHHVPADFGMHVLPKLVSLARGKRLTGYLRDIGTPETYELAEKEWEST